MAAALEERSEHPIGTAIVRGARERRLKLPTVEHFQSITGGGISGRVDGREILIGKPELVRERISAVEELEKRVSALQDRGETVVLVAIDGDAAGALSVADVDEIIHF